MDPILVVMLMVIFVLILCFPGLFWWKEKQSNEDDSENTNITDELVDDDSIEVDDVERLKFQADWLIAEIMLYDQVSLLLEDGYQVLKQQPIISMKTKKPIFWQNKKVSSDLCFVDSQGHQLYHYFIFTACPWGVHHKEVRDFMEMLRSHDIDFFFCEQQTQYALGRARVIVNQFNGIVRCLNFSSEISEVGNA